MYRVSNFCLICFVFGFSDMELLVLTQNRGSKHKIEINILTLKLLRNNTKMKSKN